MNKILKIFMSICLIVSILIPVNIASAEKSSTLFWLYNKETGTNYASLEETLQSSKDTYREAAVSDLYNTIVNKIKSSSADAQLSTLLKEQKEVANELYEAYNLPIGFIWEYEAKYRELEEQIRLIKFYKYSVGELEVGQSGDVNLNELGLEIYKQEIELTDKKQTEELGTITSVSPPLEDKYVVLTKFGAMNKSDGTSEYHYGVDISSHLGVDVYACFNGTVTYVGESSYAGSYIRISHGDGIETYYAQLQTTSVKVGDVVKQKQKIGTVGQTGTDAVGPALHFGIYINNEAVDPDILFNQGG